MEGNTSFLPEQNTRDGESAIDVGIPTASLWEKMEIYLNMMSIPLIIIAVAVVGFLLRFFKEILVPTVMALFFFQVTKPIVLVLNRPIIPFFWYVDAPMNEEEKGLITEDIVSKKEWRWCWRTIPRTICSLITLLLLVVLCGLIIYPTVASIKSFINRDFNVYVHQAQIMVNTTAEWCNRTLSIDIYDEINHLSKDINIKEITDKIASKITPGLVGFGFTILLYMFLLFGSSMRPYSKATIRFKVEDQITRYLIIKTILSTIAGVIVYLLFGLILKIPMAFLFAMCFFVLNYIPHIGPVIAVCVPIPLILFDPRLSTTAIIVAIAVPTLMNFIIQDFVEPKVLGDSLHLHPIVIIICLVIWAILWGPMGAVVAVPLTACCKIMLHNTNHRYARVIDAWLSGDFCCAHIDEKKDIECESVDI